MQESADYYKKIGETFIETYTGIQFHLDNPEFDVMDIAHTLSNICRYNGHCAKFYSVAEHSLLVADIVTHMGANGAQVLEALLHDATEAYLSDVPAPFKQLLPDWQAIDKALEQKFRIWANLPEGKTGIIKEADWIALFIEAYQLLPDKGLCFSGPEGMRGRALDMMREHEYVIHCLSPDEVKPMFLAVWAELSE